MEMKRKKIFYLSIKKQHHKKNQGIVKVAPKVFLRVSWRFYIRGRNGKSNQSVNFNRWRFVED